MPGRKTGNFPGFSWIATHELGGNAPTRGGSCPARRANPTAGLILSARSAGQFLSSGILPRGPKRSEEIVCGAVLARVEAKGSRERIRVRKCHSLPENSASRSVSRSARWPYCSWLRWLRSGQQAHSVVARERRRSEAKNLLNLAGTKLADRGNPDHRPRGSVPGLSR